ncbi:MULTISPECIES: hypothetical protein [unclassified Streptomyces]|uniref:hypothetical protein n=1 Tax=unclassified Streptomyces TaxID=2593676 RepID=UPI002E114127|nr:hypothetical protein OG452_24950 [Streptomyces sp. NBC_01197]WSS48999.1 hypothetical protein OG708_10295 [Streptomyces sp. NBC_01180]
MPPRNAVPIINTPEHHYGAMILTLLTRAPDDATLKAAVHLADNAAIAAWALRPDALVTLTVEQYRQLLDYAAAPQVLDLALYLGGNRKRIRTLADHIAREITELLTHYAPPKTQN